VSGRELAKRGREYWVEERSEEPVGFANSGGVVFVDESAKKVATK
jgi:hypothetical protein